MVTIKVEKPRRRCSEEYMKKLRKLGFKTTGYDRNLEAILKSYGFGLPKLFDDYFTFSVGEYIRMDINYADALAEELVLLKELNKI